MPLGCHAAHPDAAPAGACDDFGDHEVHTHIILEPLTRVLADDESRRLQRLGEDGVNTRSRGQLEANNLPWAQVVAGSNPAAPTNLTILNPES